MTVLERLTNPTSRPKITIKPDIADRVIEVVGIILLVLSWLFPLYTYPQLPTVIPTHFNAAGEADGFGDKANLFVLPLISLVMYYGMYTLSQYPHIFNYLVTITHDNAERQYCIATRIMRAIRVIAAAIFCYMTYRMTSVALSGEDSLEMSFYYGLVALLFVVTGYYIYRSIKLK